jgi:DNA repair protein RadC
MMKALSETPLFIVSELQLSYRPKVNPNQRPMVRSAKDAYPIFLENWNQDLIHLQEQFFMILLNTRGRVLGLVHLSSGGTKGTVVDIKIVFSTALKAMASAIVIAHNHPSGDLKPSEQDLTVTRTLVQAGKILGIAMEDHLIISPDGFLSLADEGYI